MVHFRLLFEFGLEFVSNCVRSLCILCSFVIHILITPDNQNDVFLNYLKKIYFRNSRYILEPKTQIIMFQKYKKKDKETFLHLGR
jgi:hypothetical protein